MSRLLRSVWIWGATLVLIVFWTGLLGVIRIFDTDPRRRRTARWFRRLGRLVSRVNPWRIEIDGLEHIDSSAVYVVVSNHQSLADIPVLSYLPLDTKWLAKAELFRLPLLGWMLRMAGDVPVLRGEKRSAAKAMLQCAHYLENKCSVVFFPEGTRSPDGHVLPFKEGPFQLAVRENVPILPLAVEGSGAALPRHSWIFKGTYDIHLRVLAPVTMGGWTVDQVPALRDFVRQKIVDELAALRLTPTK